MVKHPFVTAAILLMASFSAASYGIGQAADGGPDSFGIGSLFVPKVFPSGETASMIINVTAPEDIPNGSYLVINVTGPNGDLNQTREALLPGAFHEYTAPLFFSAPGMYAVVIGFESDGSYLEARSVGCLAVNADLFQNWEDAAGWTYHGSDPSLKVNRGDDRSPSGGRALMVGSGSGSSFEPGFNGEIFTYAQSPLIDLGNSTKGTLYIFHKRSFQGPLGSCGGIVQAVSGDVVEPLVPDEGYDARLRDNMSGGFGGERVFSGEEGWSLSTFDLQAFLGKEVRVRIAAVSDVDGFGNWSVDDVFIELTGPTDKDPPGSVSDLECLVRSDGSVLVSWAGPSDPDVEGYNIYLSEAELTDISGETPFESVIPDEGLIYTLNGLQKERPYWVAVTAFDAAGNERPKVDSVSFLIEEAGPNKPPVAVIVVVSQAPYRVGNDIELNAESSYDPEGDDITFSWMLPDGTRRIGDSIRWRPLEEGPVLIRLQARDHSGATNESYIELAIERPADGPIIEGNLTTFLTIALPVAFIMIMALLIVAVIRSRRRRKLELDLEEVGIVHRPQFKTECRPGTGGRKVLDLVPAVKPADHTPSAPQKVKKRSGRTTAKTPVATVPALLEPPIARDPRRDRSDDALDGRSARVNVTIECSCCGKAFRQLMGRDSLKDRNLSVRCPHCGSEGEL
jgi:DNA-directed RNA polymerase subunit RPC12/RpoP